MKTITCVICIMLVFLIFLPSCGFKVELYGQPITETKVTQIRDILTRPDQFTSKTVKLDGKIIEECPAGGWFILKDETGVMFVNLHPSDFAIPQRIGHNAVAQGIVKKEGVRIEVIGKGVELR